MAISSPGIGSNLDVNNIISQLMSIESRPLTALDRKEASFQAKLSAYGTLKGGLSEFQNAVRALASPSRFSSFKASVADAGIATASAAPGASPGAYALNVTQLAQSHKIASAGFASATTSVGTGTLTFQFGSYDSATNTFTVNASKPAANVVISSTDGSLAGIRDAVNKANIGVTASIVNDGTGNRLVFSSKESGAANSVRVTVADADGIHVDAAGLSQLAYDPTLGSGSGKNLSEVLAAKNALLTIDGIAVSSASNTLASAIEGVTLNLLKTGSTSLSVTRDTASVKTAVSDFVNAYNELDNTLKELTAYDAKTRKAAVLTGDSAARNIQSRLRSVLSSGLGGSGLSTLSEIGVSLAGDGKLQLDNAKLQSTIDDKFDQIAPLFAQTGIADDSLVSYVSATAETRPGQYALHLTQLATRGAIVGSTAANLTITAGSNDALLLAVDGKSANVTLAAGTYTIAQLAAEVQTKINGTFASQGVSVEVSHSAGVLTVTSARYGSQSNVTVTGGNGADALLGAGRTPATGIDAAGTMGGFAATGSGNTLLGNAGSPAHGLKVEIAGGSTGARGSVNFSRGFAHQLDKLVDSMLEEDGAIDSRTEGINESIEAIADQREVLERRLTQIEARLRAQYTALDALVSNLLSTSSFLQQQLASLPKTTS